MHYHNTTENSLSELVFNKSGDISQPTKLPLMSVDLHSVISKFKIYKFHKSWDMGKLLFVPGQPLNSPE